MFHFSNIVRTKGDPKIVQGGPSLKQPADQLARALGWFSIGLGVVELFAPRRVTHTLGMEGHETLVRAFGVREILAGIMSLSVDKNAGLWARVGGDGLDAAALLSPAEKAALSGGAMLNGIAYDPGSETFLLTGKLWPKLFRVRFVRR